MLAEIACAAAMWFSERHETLKRGYDELGRKWQLSIGLRGASAIRSGSRISILEIPDSQGQHATVTIMKYPVALMRTEEGYSVSCPGLPGCWSQGATEEEALSNIQDAIREYIEVAKQLAGEQNLREVEIPV
jgi:predicted RNase H-like HicB family nuclease